MVVIGGKGVGQALAAVAAALLLRLFSSPGPSMLLENEDGEFDDPSPTMDENEDSDGGIGQGRVYPVTIRWRNITCSLSDKSSNTVRLLLNNVSGEAKPGKLLAIMGPSGSGKTTLLNVLAGQVAASPRLHISGLLEINGKPSSNKAYKAAFVRQEDLFFSQLTVREAVSFAAELQLPELYSVVDRDEYVSCADTTIIGDAKVRGISGGVERRNAFLWHAN